MSSDARHHVQSFLMRESLVDKDVIKSTDSKIFRMLPDGQVVKVGGAACWMPDAASSIPWRKRSGGR